MAMVMVAKDMAEGDGIMGISGTIRLFLMSIDAMCIIPIVTDHQLGDMEVVPVLMAPVVIQPAQVGLSSQR